MEKRRRGQEDSRRGVLTGGYMSWYMFNGADSISATLYVGMSRRSLHERCRDLLGWMSAVRQTEDGERKEPYGARVQNGGRFKLRVMSSISQRLKIDPLDGRSNSRATLLLCEWLRGGVLMRGRHWVCCDVECRGLDLRVVPADKPSRAPETGSYPWIPLLVRDWPDSDGNRLKMLRR